MPVVNAGGFCLGWSSAWIYNIEHNDIQPTCWQAWSLTYTIVITQRLCPVLKFTRITLLICRFM